MSVFEAIVGEDAETLSHEELFGHLDDAEFTAAEAAEYLEVSIPTFRRYVRAGKIKASSEVGTTHLYHAAALTEFKKALRTKRS